ncbi:MAG: hypothetical protein KC983_09020 [Phycisphaerales bacterium]|nr:hypothetical protein [Phycisphaerales bacterium]
MTPTSMHRTRAFSVLELLVVISTIAMLASITYVVTSGARQFGSRMNTSNALRQMAAGYTAYTADHNGVLLPGFLDSKTLAEHNLDARLADGTPVDACLPMDGICDASAYVWRLAPYLDHATDVFLSDYRSRSVDARIRREVQPDATGHRILGPASRNPAAGDLGLAFVPSIGMNSIFLGGDTVHGNKDTRGNNPFADLVSETRYTATRLSHVMNPSMCIVFAPSIQHEYADKASSNPSFAISDIAMGSAELRPPFTLLHEDSQTWYSAQWTADNSREYGVRQVAIDESFQAGGGLPAARWGDLLPVANVDGGVTTTTLAALEIDMRRWSPIATGLHPPAIRKETSR